MNKINLKSKKGFTLIELLVVIGILAVLAAIAIPSVAGLIDRANVSADETNANEMTNAIERFASEYELYCQDIASGVIKSGQTSDFDSAQGRVFNVTGATSRADIEKLESTGLNGKQINRDTKYPVNLETAQSIVENYTKTSSSTFEPKQSDKHYYYSPDCGIVVYDDVYTTDNNSFVTDVNGIVSLNSQIVSGKDAKGNTLSENTKWIDLTNNGGIVNPPIADVVNHNEVVPEGGVYYTGVSFSVGTCSEVTSYAEKLTAGQPMPSTPQYGDVYEYGDYLYAFNFEMELGLIPDGQNNQNGWTLFTRYEKKEYEPVLQQINEKNVVNISGTFRNNKTITKIPQIPTTVRTELMMYSFAECTNIIDVSGISWLTETGFHTFENCCNADVSGFTSLQKIIKNGALGLASNCKEIYFPALVEMTDNSLYGLYNVEKVDFGPAIKKLGISLNSCEKLKEIILPSTIEEVAIYPNSCSTLTTIRFGGTIAQWNAVNKNNSILVGREQVLTIFCSDGTISSSDKLTFAFAGHVLEFEEGMTFREWNNSSYAPFKFSVNDKNEIYVIGTDPYFNTGNAIYKPMNADQSIVHIDDEIKDIIYGSNITIG